MKPPSRSKSNFKESLFLLLPSGTLLLAGAWFANNQRLENEKRQGPLRTAITKIEKLPVTKLERWQGFDWKVRIHATRQGEMPRLISGELWEDLQFDSARKLVWKFQGRQKTLTEADYKWEHEKDFVRASRPILSVMKRVQKGPEVVGTYLLRTRDLPTGGTVTLEGSAYISQAGRGRIQPPDIAP